jgi:hypothetical protein
MVIELTGHTNDRRFVIADILPAMKYTRWDDDQTLISASEHELVYAAERA